MDGNKILRALNVFSRLEMGKRSFESQEDPGGKIATHLATTSSNVTDPVPVTQ